MLPDREYVEFEPEDTIRLLTTRKYTLAGIEKVISSFNEYATDSKLEIVYESDSISQGLGNNYGFGVALVLLLKRSIR